MMKAYDLAVSFEEILGWPYVSPGSNDRNGIDCSGAFVRGFRKHGLSIAHGSNTIFRKHCDVTGRIEGDVSRLHVGMAVFKQRNDGGEPAKYRGDGFGNMYHIGLVTSVNPLRIVHATTPVAKVDTSIGQWTWYGWLADVDYAGSESPAPGEPDGEEEQPAGDRLAYVTSENGKPVHLRGDPSTKNPYTGKIALETLVTVHEVVERAGEQWARITIQWNNQKGYMMDKFLRYKE